MTLFRFFFLYHQYIGGKKRLQSRIHSTESIDLGGTVVDVLLTVKYRFEIVLSTLGLNTRGCVPARRHREALLKTSQNDISQRYRRPTLSNMPSNPRNHQYLFVPNGENRAARFPLCSQPPLSSANPLGSTEMFYIAKSMPTSELPSVRSPFYCM